MSYQRKSNFAAVIADFISHKHALGYSYKQVDALLNSFDRFCLDFFPQETVLTKEIGLRWAEKRPPEIAAATQLYRIFAVRELAKYINGQGGNAFVIPDKLTSRRLRYVPHIYTKNELTTFFFEVDHLPYRKQSPGRHLVFPVLFRLLYCCGLRPSEARTLLVENVDLKTGVIKIIESKGHKDRNVVLSPEVLDLCKKYSMRISAIFPHRKYFFSHPKGCYTACGIYEVFDLIRMKIGLTGGKNPPTVYNFRHTFATHCLYRWMQEHRYLNAYLPYLCSYLGHIRLSYTAYYIHLVPEFFPILGQMNIEKFETLLPEIER